MRALILAGGHGSRLRPLTSTRSKQLLPVANRPLLHYAVQAVAEAGCKDIGVIVGSTGPEIRAYLGDGAAWGVQVTYIEQLQPLGLAHALLQARAFLGTQPFLMFLGDNLLQGSIAPYVQRHLRQGNAATLLLCRVPDPQRFGVVKVDGERVVRLVEKPKEPESDLALTGIYLLDGRIFECAERLRPSPRGELEITDALQLLVDAGEPVVGVHVAGWWKDTGKPQDLLAANRLVLEGLQADVQGALTDCSTSGAVVISEGAQVSGSALVGPLIIGPGARISDCTLGPNLSVGQDCTLSQAVVQDSILMAGCRVERASLQHSLLGSGACVKGPGSAQVFLGDQCQVVLT